MRQRYLPRMIGKIFRILLFTWFILNSLIIPAMSANTIIDHTNWDWYNSQPQTVADRVGMQKIFFAHASVGGNVLSGFASLNTANPLKYPLVQISSGATPPASTSNGTIYEYDRGNPDWSSKVSDFATYIGNGWHDTKVNIVMNKFCFIDQGADWTVYRDSMVSLEGQYPNTKFIYWTMPLTTDSDSDAVLRAQFNQNLRDWIATQNNKLLFDIADIEAWDTTGTHHTFTSDGHIYEQMYSGYSSDGGHLNDTGSERVATGLYSLYGQVTALTLYASFTGYGLYQYNNTTWTKINTVVSSGMTASSTDLYATFTGYAGLYKWNGTAWSKINTVTPAGMAASVTELYASFTGYGTYKYCGTTWTKINTVAAAGMTASSIDLYASFTGYGLYKWNGTAWSRLTTLIPVNMMASGTDLYASFTGYGLYKWNGTAWSRINTIVSSGMTTSISDLYATFTGYTALYKWNGTAWSKINTIIPVNMAASGTDLYASFTGYGTYKYSGTTWTKINTLVAAAMTGSR